MTLLLRQLCSNCLLKPFNDLRSIYLQAPRLKGFPQCSLSARLKALKHLDAQIALHLEMDHVSLVDFPLMLLLSVLFHPLEGFLFQGHLSEFV